MKNLKKRKRNEEKNSFSRHEKKGKALKKRKQMKSILQLKLLQLLNNRLNEWKRKLSAKRRTKLKRDHVINIRMFLGIHTTKRCIEKLKTLEMEQLTKPETTFFLLTRSHRAGTVIKKTYTPFKDIEAYNICIDQIQLK